MTLSKFFIFFYSILSLKQLGLLLDFLSLFFCFLGCAVSLYITFSIGRKFDRLFGDVSSPYLPDLGWYSTVLRSLCDARLIASKNRLMPKKVYKERYGDFDFYESASPLQRIACALYYVSVILTFIFMVVNLSIIKLTS